MQVAAKPLVEVYEALSTALDELDKHGEAMAALHLAMAVDCLASCIGAEPAEQASQRPRPHLRLVTDS
jgi:predicted trehalose synthase